MNIAEYSIRKRVITWVLTLLLVAAGIMAFNNLSRLEDPEFTIKEALIYTPYPGASAAEVEEEVTNVIEKAVQEMGQLDYVESRSSRGLSIVKAYIKKTYDSTQLPQVWDELRRKVNDRQSRLPPGAGPSIVNDDFGDVYGVYLAITGEGYTFKEIYDYAKYLQRELLQVQDVKRIILFGNQPEAVFVEMRREKMAEFGVSPQEIYSALASKNLAVTAGNVTLGTEYLAVNPTGEFQSEHAFGDLLIRGKGSDSGRLVYLRDVAQIKRGYREPAGVYLRYDGKPAVGMGISTISGGNVVAMGEALAERFRALESMAPVGMEMHVVSLQSQAVKKAISGFIVNLGQAVAIVIVVLLLFMGLRSGLIIGAILFITIMGTFVFMDMGDITLERISLGALVIALGMLVDNAIVVTDGMRMKIRMGEDGLTAAREVVGQTAIPLLGATIVAITAFASIGTSSDATGEYCRSLFTVIFISLMLSWVTAVTSTPLLCKTFLGTDKKKVEADSGGSDPYGGRLFTIYRYILTLSIRARWITMAVVAGLFMLSLTGFGYVKSSFFPDATRPQFYVDFWFPEGTHIEETLRQMQKAENYLLKQEAVLHATTEIGGGQPRFLLTYSPEYPNPNFARILIDVADYKKIGMLTPELQSALEMMFSQAVINVRMFVNGPSTGGKIQLRINGPEADQVRRLAEKAKRILLEDPEARAVRGEWGNKVKVVRPRMAEVQARRAGIERPDLARALEMAVEGTTVGVYRESDELLPIIARSPEFERTDMSNLGAVQVWSPAARKMISVSQVVTGFETVFEDPHIWRRDRQKMLKLHADPVSGFSSELLARVKPAIEKALTVDVTAALGNTITAEGNGFGDDYTAATIPIVEKALLPLKDRPGYSISWGGEAEDSARAQAALASTLPIFFGLMVLIVLFLFNSIKKTMIIWLTVPLSIIGVTAGLLMFSQPFGFMSLLGLMSLSGMLIKNAIVLIDQIDTEIASGKPGFQAIVDSGVSRLIPVAMAALTTILGMVPLLKDAFFVAMAVTIMFGLGFATLLTLIVVPVLYAIFFRVPNAQG